MNDTDREALVDLMSATITECDGLALDNLHADWARLSVARDLADYFLASDWLAARVAAAHADAVQAERERLAEEWRTLPVWGPDPSGLHILDGVDLEGLLDDLWDRRKPPTRGCRAAVAVPEPGNQP